MRVSSINIAQPRNFNHNLRLKNAQQPHFEGKGGVRGLYVGTAIALGLTALSGGALAWTIPLIGGSVAMGGDILEKMDKPSNDSYESVY